MIPYNPSSFDRNKTILEQILELKNWLKAHPSYEIFYSSENGQSVADTGYLLSAIADPTNLAVGDVVIFSNVMVGVVLSVDADNGTYGCDACVSFKGPQGATGPAGADGQNGTDGTCIRYCNYNKNLNPNTTYATTDLNFSTGLQINDCILFKNNKIGFVDNISTGIFRVTGNITIDGKDGKYVSNAEVDANGDLLIYITDPETSVTTIDNVGHVVGPAGTGMQIVALTSNSGTLSADDLSKVTGTDDCIITYTNAGATMVFKRAIIDSSSAYFTNVVVDGDTYYLYCEVDVTTGQYDLGIDQLPIKASNINSETATNGQVLTADGNGGASWQSAGGGGATLYLHSCYLYWGTYSAIRFCFTSTKSTAYTTLADLYADIGGMNIVCNGKIRSSGGDNYIPYQINLTSSSTATFGVLNPTGMAITSLSNESLSSYTFSGTIKQL